MKICSVHPLQKCETRTKQLLRKYSNVKRKARKSQAMGQHADRSRLGELRDCTYENQRYRASGLNLVVAAIVLWNTVSHEGVVTTLRQREQIIRDDLLTHLSPLGWEHINLTGSAQATARRRHRQP